LNQGGGLTCGGRPRPHVEKARRKGVGKKISMGDEGLDRKKEIPKGTTGQGQTGTGSKVKEKWTANSMFGEQNLNFLHTHDT